jgi:hypothetical protein
VNTPESTRRLSDAFEPIFGAKRGRIRRKRRRRNPGDPRPLAGIAADCLRRPSDPTQVEALVAELREHWGQRLGTRAVDEPLGRFVVASLAAGLSGLDGQRPPSARRGRSASQLRAHDADALGSERALALARVRLLYADMVGDNAAITRKTISSRGRVKGLLRGDALRRHREQLAHDRSRVARDGNEPASA